MNAGQQAGLGDDGGAPLRVLVIEDSEGFAYFVQDILTRKRRGATVVRVAGTLAEGLAALADAPADVILLDLGLPDSARMDTFVRVRGAAGAAPIIVLTVLDDDAVALQAMREGAQDYLVKDEITEGLLLRAIRYAVERGRAQRALQQLSARILSLQDEERRRIARAMHDSTAQTLAALGMNLASLQRRVPPEAAELRALADAAAVLAERCTHEVRTMAYLLHPPLLDELGLAGAVRDYADGFAARSGIRVDLELSEEFPRLPREVETAVFRVMQECLANIHRHSGSRTASIRIACGGGRVRMSVADRGSGMPPESAREGAALGVGIAGMRERVQQLGGTLSIRSGPQGTTVEAAIPIAEVTP